MSYRCSKKWYGLRWNWSSHTAFLWHEAPGPPTPVATAGQLRAAFGAPCCLMIMTSDQWSQVIPSHSSRLRPQSQASWAWDVFDMAFYFIFSFFILQNYMQSSQLCHECTEDDSAAIRRLKEELEAANHPAVDPWQLSYGSRIAPTLIHFHRDFRKKHPVVGDPADPNHSWLCRPIQEERRRRMELEELLKKTEAFGGVDVLGWEIRGGGTLRKVRKDWMVAQDWVIKIFIRGPMTITNIILSYPIHHHREQQWMIIWMIMESWYVSLKSYPSSDHQIISDHIRSSRMEDPSIIHDWVPPLVEAPERPLFTLG